MLREFGSKSRPPPLTHILERCNLGDRGTCFLILQGRTPLHLILAGTAAGAGPLATNFKLNQPTKFQRHEHTRNISTIENDMEKTQICESKVWGVHRETSDHHTRPWTNLACGCSLCLRTGWLVKKKVAFFVTRADRIRRYTYFHATEILVRIF